MKARLFKSVVVLILLCLLAFSLTGCDSLNYREAVKLYNAQDYDKALEIFTELGEYEDSAQLITRCKYWIAIEAMEYGRYDSAMEQFQALNGYEDSAERITECKYQLAIAAFDSEEYASAEALFLEIPDYQQVPEYLRRLNWQKFFDAVAETGTESGGSFTLQKEQDGKVYSVTADLVDPGQLIFFVSDSKDMGYTFYDDLTITLSRDDLQAAFTATSMFAMDFKGSQIGSQQRGTGTLDITACTGETPLTLTGFEKTATDNLGKTTTSTDPADSLMGGDMAENLSDLLSVIPELLLDAGIELTLADIGFAAIQ